MNTNKKPTVTPSASRKRLSANDAAQSMPLTHPLLPRTKSDALKWIINCDPNDFYTILGLPHLDCQDSIRKHYHRLALLVHPDKNKSKEASEAFKMLQTAYKTLGEPEKRKIYDRKLKCGMFGFKTNANDILFAMKELHARLEKVSFINRIIKCIYCEDGHQLTPVNRMISIARWCRKCKAPHRAYEGEIWVEPKGAERMYLTVLEDKVYDFTEWVLCQHDKFIITIPVYAHAIYCRLRKN